MIPASFRYAAPQSVSEAVALLGAHEDSKVLAGGHSLLPLMKLRLANPPVLAQMARRGPWNDCASLPAVVEAASQQTRIGLVLADAEFDIYRFPL